MYGVSYALEDIIERLTKSIEEIFTYKNRILVPSPVTIEFILRSIGDIKNKLSPDIKIDNLTEEIYDYLTEKGVISNVELQLNLEKVPIYLQLYRRYNYKNKWIMDYVHKLAQHKYHKFVKMTDRKGEHIVVYFEALEIIHINDLSKANPPYIVVTPSNVTRDGTIKWEEVSTKAGKGRVLVKVVLANLESFLDKAKFERIKRYIQVIPLDTRDRRYS